MPELPEVETIRRQLAPLVEGRRLKRVEILDWRWSRPLAPSELAEALQGRRVERLSRRGKYLVWELEDEVYLVQHLRMTGSVLYNPDPEPSHTRVRIDLGRGRRLAIVDPRRFGTGELLAGSGMGAKRVSPGSVGSGMGAKRVSPGSVGSGMGAKRVSPGSVGSGMGAKRVSPGSAGQEALEAFFAARLGLEPLDELFTAEHLRAQARGRTAPVKAFLLDQRRIAGVGNIYADEALFRAGIHPLRPAGKLSAEQYERLRETTVATLRAGIDARGATIDDFRHVDGVRGSFQNEFLVHRREGEPCGICGTTIVKMVVAGRGTYVCETCQPRPRLKRVRA